jgi:hypothetical protein
MKSTFLKAIKAVALSLVLSLGASSVVLANGGGNGAGGSTTRKTKNKRVAKRVVKNKRKHTA